MNQQFKVATPLVVTSSSMNSTLTSTPNKSTPTFAFSGFTGNLQPTTPKADNVTENADTTKKTSQPSPFANFTFGQSANKSFSELFSGISKTPTAAPVVNDMNKSNEAHDEDVDHFEPNVHFEPVIALPELVEVKTGEEEEEIKFVHRAKLLRYDATNKEWKERGIGEMKVLVSKKNSSKARLLMRREQVLKLCCNMSITKELDLKKMNATTYSFAGQDFSENEIHAEFLAIKFKTSELVEKFVAAVKEAQSNLNAQSTQECKTEEKKPAETKGFGDKFKPKVGSWTCEGCYISNKPDDLYCVACDAPKDNTVPKKEAKSAFAPDPNAPTFSFGIPNASGFSFGMPASTENTTQAPINTNEKLSSESFTFGQTPLAVAKPTFGSFGSTAPASTFSFTPAIPNLTSNATTEKGFSFGGDKPFSFSVPSENKENDDSNNKADSPAVTSSNSGFNFVFKKKSPGKKSPGKSRNDSVNSEGAEEVEEEENEYHEEEENQTYFTPVIALPEKVELKTGEENEDVLYSHRAKLFRFTDKEWKERGLGDVKILRHKHTGKLR